VAPDKTAPALPADTTSSVPSSDIASADHSTASLSAPIDASNPSQPSDTHHVNVLVVSDSLENAEELFKSANSDTILIRYNDKSTTGAELLQEITDALHGEKADSIGFVTDKAHDGSVKIFADSATSEKTLSTETQQKFWNGVEGLLSEKGKVNIFASDLASTATGRHLVDSLSQITNHQVAASTDVTGDKDAGGDWELEYVAKGSGSVDLIEEYFNRESIQSFEHRIEKATEIAFIDSSVQDIDTIIKGIGEQAEIVYLNKDHAFEQITSYLQGRSDVDAVHLVSEGTAGEFYLGSETINSDFVASHHDELAAWGKAMAADGDIHIYGCNVAKDQVGKDLVDQISIITGADVASSTDRTGIAGNWNLEFTAGEIQTAGFVIGDYLHNLQTYTVVTLNDATVNSAYIDPKTLTLREALYLSVNGDNIVFAAQTTTTPTIYLIDTLLIDKNITIDGTIVVTPPGGTAATYSVTIDAHGVYRALCIDSLANGTSGIVMSNMNFVNGSAGDGGGILVIGKSYVDMTNIQVTGSHAESGGGIYNAGILNLFNNSVNTKAYVNSNLNISGNTASNSGGGIYNAGTLTYIGDGQCSGINNNTATNGYGGGIYNSGSLTIKPGSSSWTSFDLRSNTADGDGGGIYSNNQNISLNYVWLFDNHALQGSGGGIYVFANYQTAAVTLNDVFAYSNTAGQDGGGFYFTNANSASTTANVLNLDRCYFYSNTASGNGGGTCITNTTGGIILSDIEMTWNEAIGNGGALCLANNSGTISIKSINIQSEFRNNSAAGDGGAIYIDNCLSKTSLLAIDFVNISNNSAVNGGGIYIANSTGRVTLADVEMASNAATGNGGGIYCSNGIPANFNITSSNISNNTANSGGGIYLAKGTLNIENCTLSYNGTDQNTVGGAIYMDYGTLEVRFSTIAYNKGIGAAIYMLGDAYNKSNLTVGNAIIYNLDSDFTGLNPSAQSQIYMPVMGERGTIIFYLINNIYSHYYVDAVPGATHSLVLTNTSSKLIGSDATKSTAIQSNLWLDETLRYHANYRTMALAILSQDSWAIINAGTPKDYAYDKYDQRGNTRGTTWSWDQTKQTWKKGVGFTVGAFEPIFHVVINSKTTVDSLGQNVGGDDSSLTQISDQKARYFINAMGGYYEWNSENLKYDWHSLGGTGMTLREAVYWVDTRAALDPNNPTYYTDPTGGSNNFTIDDYNSRYIEFDSTLFSAGVVNNIQLNYGVITVEGASWGFTYDHDTAAYRDLAVAYLIRDPDNSGNILYHDHTLRAPDATGRITVVAGTGGLFYISGSSVAAINNLTLTDGNASYYSAYNGGGIYNEGGTNLTRTTLTNVVVQNCTAASTLSWTYSYGGGVYNSGSMNIYDSRISNNTVSAPYDVRGGGVYNSGIMNIDRTQIDGNTASYTLARPATDTGVMDAQGGGIYNSGSLLVERSEISGNSLSGVADATHNINIQGGGIYNSSQDFKIANSTIAENTLAGVSGIAWNSFGSGIYNGGTLYSYYNTIANNQLTGSSSAPAATLAGLYQANTAASSLFLSNCILAGNITGSTRADIYINTTASVNASSDYNIVGAYNITVYDWNVNSNIIGDSTGLVYRLNLDFTSGLQYYGALTRSYRVLAGSVAMDSGIVLDPANPLYSGFYNLTSDQRGVDRGNPDDATNRGAFDNLDTVYVRSTLDSSTPRTVSDGFDYASYTPLWESNTFMLREAVNLADYGTCISFKDGWRINGTVDPATGLRVTNELDASGKLVIKLVSQLDVNPFLADINREINGSFTWFDKSGTLHEGGMVQLKAGTDSRIFNIVSSANLLSTVAISNFTISGGNVSGNGGGIYSAANLTLDNVTIQTCTAKASAANNDGFGGGIYSENGYLYVLNSMLGGKTAASGNSALMGGGIYSASYDAGSYVLDISGSSILNNVAKDSTAKKGDGGGIYLQSGKARIDYSTIGLNKAAYDGGGIIVQTTGDLTMINSTVSNNSAGRNGGGISFYSSNNLNLDFATVANNQSGWSVTGAPSRTPFAFGGGIYIFMNRCVLNLDNSILAQNYCGSSKAAAAVHDDLYLNTSNPNYIDHSIYGTVTGTPGYSLVPTNSTQVVNWTAFKGQLDTKLTDNGGHAMTVYVMNSSGAYDLKIADPLSAVDFDQTHLENFGTDRITAGAYENSVNKTLYYISGNLATGRDNGSVWISANGIKLLETDGVLNANNTTFVFDNHMLAPLATLNGTWTVNGSDWTGNNYSWIELHDSSWLKISSTGLLSGRVIASDNSTFELATCWTSGIMFKIDHSSDLTAGGMTNVIYDSTITFSTLPERENWFYQNIFTQETITNPNAKTTVEYDNLHLYGNEKVGNAAAPLNIKNAFSDLHVNGNLIVGNGLDNVKLNVANHAGAKPGDLLILGANVNNLGQIAVAGNMNVTGTATVPGFTTIDGNGSVTVKHDLALTDVSILGLTNSIINVKAATGNVNLDGTINLQNVNITSGNGKVLTLGGTIANNTNLTGNATIGSATSTVKLFDTNITASGAGNNIISKGLDVSNAAAWAAGKIIQVLDSVPLAGDPVGSALTINIGAQSLALTDNMTGGSLDAITLGVGSLPGGDRLLVEGFSRLSFVTTGTVTSAVTAPSDYINGTLALAGKINLGYTFSTTVKSTATLELGGTITIDIANVEMANNLSIVGNITLNKALTGDVSITSTGGNLVFGSDVTFGSKFTGNGSANLLLQGVKEVSVGNITKVNDLTVTSGTGNIHLLNSITVSGNVIFINPAGNVLLHKAFATSASKLADTSPTPIIITAASGAITTSGTGYASYLGDGSELQLSAGSPVLSSNLNTVDLNRSLTLLKGIYTADSITLDGTLTSTPTIANFTIKGKLAVEVFGNISMFGGKLDNSGALSVSGDILMDNGTLNNSDSGAITMDGAGSDVSLTGNATFVNAGIFNNASSNVTLENGSLSNSKTLNAASIIFTSAGSLTNSSAGSMNIADVITLAGGSLTNSGALTAGGALTLTGTGALNNNSGNMTVYTLTMENGNFNNRAAFTTSSVSPEGITFTGTGNFINSSALKTNLITLAGGTLNNSGSISGNNPGAFIDISGMSSFTNSGTMTTVSSIIFDSTGSLTNSGKLTVAGDIIFAGGSLINLSAGTLSASSITITGNGALINSGTMNNSDTFVILLDSSYLTNARYMTVNSITFIGNGSLNNNAGTLNASYIELTSGNLTNKGILNANETYFAAGSLLNSGTLKVTGAALHDFNITLLGGNLTNNGTMTVDKIYMVEDKLVSNGTFIVNDTLQLNAVNISFAGTSKVDSLVSTVRDSVFESGKLIVKVFYFGTETDPFPGTALSFQLNTAATLEINGEIKNGSYEHVFVTYGNGKVWVNPALVSNVWLSSSVITDGTATLNPVSEIGISGGTTKLVGIGTFTPLTVNGLYNGKSASTAVLAQSVNRVWTITRTTGDSKALNVTMNLHWVALEQGIYLDNNATMYYSTGTSWSAGPAGTIDSINHTFDTFMFNNTKSGSYGISMGPIAMNDTNSFFGNQFDELKEKFIDAIFGAKEEFAAQPQIAGDQERTAMETMLSQMADRGNLMERNQLFKTDVDLSLESLLMA
jgi:hypothetical protein